MSSFFLCTLSLTFLHLLHIVTGAIPVLQSCPRVSGTVSTHSVKQNLKSILKDLSSPESSSKGFSVFSVGESGNKVNGLTLCQGYLNTTACKACLAEATGKIKQCSNNLHAIIWYEGCFVKYSNEDFFGEVDLTNQFTICNRQEASNANLFDVEVDRALNKVMEEAYVKSEVFAFGKFEVKFNETSVLYALGQCTRDLSSGDCKSCLECEIEQIGAFCRGKVGGRGVGGSCNIRYEIYPFFNA